MLLAVNLGNSNIAFGVFDGTELVRHDHIETKFLQMLPDRIGDERITHVALASVVPSHTDRLVALLASSCNAPILLAGHDLPYGINIECEEPDKVGADRILNAVAAFARTRSATMVVDAGTAVTVDVVSYRGNFDGGAIAPGPELMLRALHEHTGQLPEVDFQAPPSPAGRNTADAMRAGVYFATVGLVNALVARFKSLQGEATSVIMTGGHADWLAKEMAEPAEVIPALTLEGLAILAQREQSR